MFYKSTDKNNGFNSSQDMVNEVSRVFKNEYIGKSCKEYTTKNGKIVKTLC